MCILAGFPSTPNKSATVTAFPFGIWFADAHCTVYIADEGDGYTGGTDLYTHAAAQTTAGLQKWVFNSATGNWSLAYVLQTDLGLGVPYTVTGYPSGPNAATGLPWAPAAGRTSRNITGRVGRDWQSHDMGNHLHDQRKRRHRRRSEPTGRRRGSPREHGFDGRRAREIPYVAHGEIRRGALRGVSFTPGTDLY